MTFCPSLSHAFRDLDEILVNQHKMLPSFCEFHENPPRKAVRFVWAAKKSHLPVWVEPCDILKANNVVVKTVLRHRLRSLWFFLVIKSVLFVDQ